MNTTGHARGTHYQIHFKNTQVMEATLKKQRHQGALVITGPLVSPALTYLSALSGCRVTRTEGGKFAQRTTQEKNAFIKSMLQTYAEGQSFHSASANGQKKTMEEGWCSVLHEFLTIPATLRDGVQISNRYSILAAFQKGFGPFTRLKIKLCVDLGDKIDRKGQSVLPDFPRIHPCARLLQEYARKLFLFKSYWNLPLQDSYGYEDFIDKPRYLYPINRQPLWSGEWKQVRYDRPFDKMCKLPNFINASGHSSESFITWLEALEAIRDPDAGCILCITGERSHDGESCHGDCEGPPLFSKVILNSKGDLKHYVTAFDHVGWNTCWDYCSAWNLKGWDLKGDYYGTPKITKIDQITYSDVIRSYSEYPINSYSELSMCEVPIRLSSKVPAELRGVNICLEGVCQTEKDGSLRFVEEYVGYFDPIGDPDEPSGDPVYASVARFKLQLPSRVGNLLQMGRTWATYASAYDNFADGYDCAVMDTLLRQERDLGDYFIDDWTFY